MDLMNLGGLCNAVVWQWNVQPLADCHKSVRFFCIKVKRCFVKAVFARIVMASAVSAVEMSMENRPTLTAITQA